MAKVRRLPKAEQQQILKDMFALARFLASEGMPLREVTQAVGQVRDDLVNAYGQGIELHVIEESSLPQKENI